MARVSSGLISIVVAATSTAAWTVSTGKRAIIKKVMWINRTGGNGFLRIGYLTNVPGWVQVSPDILMVNGVDGQLTEAELPVMGNSAEGFCVDGTVGAGCTGVITLQASVGGAAPTDVQVMLEIEEV